MISMQNTGTPVASARIPRLGLIKMHVGSTHTLRGANGTVSVSGECRARNRHAKAAVKWVCLHAACVGQKFDSEADLVAKHPEDDTMVRQAEKHVYGMWSDEQVANPSAKLIKTDKGDVAPKIALGFLSDE